MHKPFVTLSVALLLFSTSALAQRADCIDGQAVQGTRVYACNDVHLLAHLSLAEMGATWGNDSWGWTDPLNGDEYALMGLENGTFFVDITNPEAPRLLGKLPTATDASIWRSIKVYADHAFIVSEASGHGMQVFDLSRLRELSEDPSRVFQADVTFTGPAGNTLGRTHTVFINEDTGFAYAVGARNLQGSYVCSGGLYMIDLNVPASPQFAGCFSQDGYTHDIQCVVYDGPDTAYQGRELCFANNETRLTVVDVTDKSNPVMVSQTTYPNIGYTHQAWLTSDHRYLVLNDELQHFTGTQDHRTRTIFLDVSNLQSPFYMGDYRHPTYSIHHDLYVKNDRVYAANYMSGLRILDATSLVRTGSLDAIETVGYFDTYHQKDCTVPDSECINSFQGAWGSYPFFPSGVIIVSDIDNGLYILAEDPPTTGNDSSYENSRIEIKAFPNPFRDGFQVELVLETEQNVHMELLDVLGRRVTTGHQGMLSSGRQTVEIRPQAISPGIYILRITGDDFSRTVRLTHIP